MEDATLNQAGVVIVGNSDGHTVIPSHSPLKRLRYFDGKFLRAPDMELEQQALLNYSRLSNQAGGAGVVHGMSCLLQGNGDALAVSAGLAIDASGNLLYLPSEVTVDIQTLINKSSTTASGYIPGSNFFISGGGFEECVEAEKAKPPGEVLTGHDLYIIVAEYTNAFCGEEDVYGKLCEEACINSKERPYAIDGILLRAIPLKLSALLPESSKVTLAAKHFRSRVAAAYFEQERDNPASLISKDGLSSMLWCLGAEALGGAGVPLAVVARSGAKTLFLDNWIARRERIDVPPKQYWAGRMAMRSWQTYLAHILQFQCQLSNIFGSGGGIGYDPCADEHRDIAELSHAYERLLREYETIARRLQGGGTAPVSKAASEYKSIKEKMVIGKEAMLPTRFLVNSGFVELPSAGYLPISLDSALTVNEQVRRMMGEGVDLRFCVVRPDYVPHALEEAQHMERISLLEGIDNPANKPRIDVLVPNGQIEELQEEAPGTAYEMQILPVDVSTSATISKLWQSRTLAAQRSKAADTGAQFSQLLFSSVAKLAVMPQRGFYGAARDERSSDGAYEFYFAAGYQDMRSKGDVTIQREQILQQAADVTLASSSEGAAPETAKKAYANLAEQPMMDISGSLQALNTLPDISLWTMLRTDDDPFGLSRGESTNLRGQVDLGMAYDIRDIDISMGLECEINGNLYIVDIGQKGNDIHLRCRLDGRIHVKMTMESPNHNGSDSNFVDISQEVRLTRSPAFGDKYSSSFDIPGIINDPRIGQIGFRFERVWQNDTETSLGASLVVALKQQQATEEEQVYRKLNYLNASMTTSASQRVVPLLQGRQRINADVLKPANEYHDISLHALRTLGNILNNSNYADIKARLLFPPPKPVADELKVHAREDWVLFHRRRDHHCGYEQMPEAMIKPRRYRVFNVNVASQENLQILADALANNNGPVINRFMPEVVSVTEFEAGIQSLHSSPDDLRADWQTHVTVNGEIAMGVIASRGEAYDEGAVLAESRLEKLTDVLAPVIELGENAQLSVLSQIPDVLPVGDMDGIILFATLGVSVVCHRVYRLEIQETQINDFVKAIDGGYEGAISQFGGQLVEVKPQFKNTTTELYGSEAEESFNTAWDNVGDNNPVQYITLVNPDENGNIPSDQPYEDQSKTLAGIVNGVDVSGEIIAVPDQIPACKAITILITLPEQALGLISVSGLLLASIQPDTIRDLISNSASQNGYFETLANINQPIVSLGVVNYDESDTANNTDLSNVKQTAYSYQLWGNFDGRHYYVISVSKKGTPADEMTRNQVQAEQIRNEFNITNPLVSVENGTDFWNEDSTSSVLLLAVDEIGFIVGINTLASEDFVNPEDLVTEFKEAVTFDETGGVIKDAAFEKAVSDLQANETVIKTVEVVGATEEAAAAEAAKAEALLAELKTAGVVEESTSVVTRVANAEEQKLILSDSLSNLAGLVLRQ